MERTVKFEMNDLMWARLENAAHKMSRMTDDYVGDLLHEEVRDRTDLDPQPELKPGSVVTCTVWGVRVFATVETIDDHWVRIRPTVIGLQDLVQAFPHFEGREAFIADGPKACVIPV